MRIAIIGSGGVGGFFGGKMAQAGCDVIFFARGEHLKAMLANGLTVRSIRGDFNIDPVKATDQMGEIGKVDLIILCVKAWQVKDISDELLPLVDKDTMILPLQNGVMAADELKEKINPENIIGGLCKIISKIEAPGIIHHIGVDPFIVFGELNNSQTPRMHRIKELMDASGIHSKIAENIQAELWKKFMAICVSGLLAVTRSTYGEVCEVTGTRLLMLGLFHEIYALSQKMGIKIESDIVEKTVAFIDTLPYDSTTSLSRDVIGGKPSEIEYQNGTVVKLGLTYGVETPINSFIYNCVLPMENRARNWPHKNN